MNEKPTMYSNAAILLSTLKDAFDRGPAVNFAGRYITSTFPFFSLCYGFVLMGYA